jgi:hypothetical protein
MNLDWTAEWVDYLTHTTVHHNPMWLFHNLVQLFMRYEREVDKQS